MTLNASTVFDAALSHAMALGLFERVNGHEPKNAPGNGLTLAMWAQDITPIPSSGLASTSAQLVLNQRIYSAMEQEPQDAIDPNIINAVDVLFTAYSGDFTLGGLIRCVDLLGQHGVRLAARAGYLPQDGVTYRVMTITLPLLINDAWTQAP